MPTFRFKVRNAEGQVVTGSEEASSKEALAEELRQRGAVPLTIQALAGTGTQTKAAPPISSTKRQPAKSAIKRRGKVRDEDLLMFTRELDSLVRSGIPILAGLKALANQTSHATLRQTIENLANDVEMGGKLSEALAKYPRIFSEVYIASVAAGEASGQLSEVLNHLVALLEHQIETKSSIATATRYPLIVLVALGVGFGVIVNFVLPRFANFYAQFNAELPLATRLMIQFGSFVHDNGFFVLCVVGALIFLFRWFISTSGGRVLWDGFKLKLPIFGDLYLKIALLRFAATLEMLYASGVPITEAFVITSRVVDNVIIRRAILKIRESVMAGAQMADAMQGSPIFPPLVIQMMATGEQTGSLDQHLRDIAEHYDRQIKYTTKNLATLIEPILTVLLGGMVLVFALAIFLPMWNMISVFKR